MNQNVLLEYTLRTIQEEGCFIWDGVLMDPEKWAQFEEAVQNWNEDGSWLSRMADKLVDTYKE